MGTTKAAVNSLRERNTRNRFRRTEEGRGKIGEAARGGHAMPPLPLLAAVLAVVFASSEARLASPRLSSLDTVRFRRVPPNHIKRGKGHNKVAKTTGTLGAAGAEFEVPADYDRRERPGGKEQV